MKFYKFFLKKQNLRVKLIIFIPLFFTTILFFLIVFQSKNLKSEKNLLNFIDNKESSIKKVDNEQILKLLFLGDIMLARSIAAQIESGDNPFENLISTFRDYDYIVANLETTVSRVGFPVLKAYTFNAPIKSVEILKNSGISIVSLANNHVGDYGKNALLDMFSILKDYGIVYFGAGENQDLAFEPKFIVDKRLTFALLGFNDIETWYTDATKNSPGTANFNKEQIEKSIKKAKEQSSIVIVMPHWGNEYELISNERQEEYGKFFIEAGADIVVGAHPHVVQNSHEYKGKMIYYSLGNFVFDGMEGIFKATEGAMLEVIVTRDLKLKTRLINIKLNHKGFPELKWE